VAYLVFISILAVDLAGHHRFNLRPELLDKDKEPTPVLLKSDTYCSKFLSDFLFQALETVSEGPLK
jgi:hypothetical protein